MRVVRGPVDPDGAAIDVEGTIVVDETQRRRSRFRTRTNADEEVGVVVDGAGVLSTGDVLESDDGERFTVELEAIEALVVGFEGEHDPAAMVAAGHAVGNRHWELVAHERRVYVPTGGDAEGRIAFLEPHLPPDATVRVERVEPSLFDDTEPGHGTTHGADSRRHDHDHDHSQTHDHDHTHTESTTMTRDQLRRTAQEPTDE